MEGEYVMLAPDGTRFPVIIPAFALELPGRLPPVH
jgi:uncharacterized protein affecting Mg2+/Co2+ transport